MLYVNISFYTKISKNEVERGDAKQKHVGYEVWARSPDYTVPLLFVILSAVNTDAINDKFWGTFLSTEFVTVNTTITIIIII